MEEVQIEFVKPFVHTQPVESFFSEKPPLSFGNCYYANDLIVPERIRDPSWTHPGIPNVEPEIHFSLRNHRCGPFEDPFYPEIGFFNPQGHCFNTRYTSGSFFVSVNRTDFKKTVEVITPTGGGLFSILPGMKLVLPITSGRIAYSEVPTSKDDDIVSYNLNQVPSMRVNSHTGTSPHAASNIQQGKIGTVIPPQRARSLEPDVRMRSLHAGGVSMVKEHSFDDTSLGEHAERTFDESDVGLVLPFSHFGYYELMDREIIVSGSKRSGDFIFINTWARRRTFFIHTESGVSRLELKPLHWAVFNSTSFTMIEQNCQLELTEKKVSSTKRVQMNPRSLNLSTIRYPHDGFKLFIFSGGQQSSIDCLGLFPNSVEIVCPKIFTSRYSNRPDPVFSRGAMFVVLSMLLSVSFALCGPGEIDRCSYCFLPALASCNAGFECDSGSCILGVCLVGQKPCPARSQCLNRFCDDSANTCCTTSSNCPGDHVCLKSLAFPSSGNVGICKKAQGMSCSDDSDCASGQCPVGGGSCTGPNGTTDQIYCCDLNGMAAVCPTPSPSASATISPSRTGSPSGSTTPTGSVTPTGSSTSSIQPSSAPTFSGTLTPTVSLASTAIPSVHPSLTLSPVATPPMTPQPTLTAVASPPPSASCDHCHMMTRNVPFDKDNIREDSGSSALSPSFPFSLFIKGAQAVPCKSGKFLLNLATTQSVGTSLISNCSFPGCPYSYDPVVKAGFADPNVQDFDDCPQIPRPVISLPRTSRSLLAVDEILSVDLTDNLFTITFTGGDAERIITLQLQGEMFTEVCRASVCFIAVNPEMLSRSSKAVFSSIENGVVTSTKVLDVTGKKLCYVKDCWWCNIRNWSCVPKIFKAMFIILCILASLICIYLLFKIGVLTLSCLILISKGFWVFLWGIYQIMQNQVIRMTMWFEESKRPIARTLVIMSLILGVSCCDSSTIITGSLKSCEFSGIEEICTLEHDSLISLSGPGSTSCIVFQKDGVPFGQIEIEMTSNQITCDLADSYYTSSFKTYSSSKFHCQGAFGTNCTTDCSSTTLRTDSTYFDPVDDFLDFPGITSCNRQCSGIGCGCLLPTLGCVYTTFSFIPEGPAMRVSRYINCQNTPIITYTIRDTLGVKSSGSFSYEGGSSDDGTVLLSISSALDRVPPSDLPSHVCEGAKRGFCDASYRGSPLPGKIGDIQSNSTSSLETGDFIVSDEIFVSYNHQNKYNKVVTRSPGYNTDFKSVPAFYSGLAWSIDSSGSSVGSKIFAYDTRPSPILVSLQTTNNVTLSRTVTRVCPDAQHINTTGCFGCLSGFTTCFKVKSTCFDGSALLTSEHIAPQLIQITRNTQTVCVQGFTNDTQVDETVKIGNSTFKAKGTLESSVELGQETILFTGEEVPAHVSFRKGGWKWWEYLVASIVMFLALLFFISLLVFMVPCLYSLISGLRVVKMILPKHAKHSPNPVREEPPQPARTPGLRRRPVVVSD